jgi:hypothetical protein
MRVPSERMLAYPTTAGPLAGVVVQPTPTAKPPVEGLGYVETTDVVAIAVASTFRLKVSVWVAPPPTPVIVMVYVPGVVVEAAVYVSVEVPLPGAAKLPGLKLIVTPAGTPVADNVTAALKRPVSSLVTQEVVVLPATTYTSPG